MYRDDQIKSSDIIGILRKRHKDDIAVEELRLSSGVASGSGRRIDFWAISPSPAKGNLAIAYEVKTSRTDFKRETHDKQRGARLFSDKFYFIAPPGIIERDEVPDWAGLYEVRWEAPRWGNNKPYLAIREIVPAPKRCKDSPSWGLVCSIIRGISKQQ